MELRLTEEEMRLLLQLVYLGAVEKIFTGGETWNSD